MDDATPERFDAELDDESVLFEPDDVGLFAELDAAEEAAALARAEADIAAGRVVPQATVSEWLLSLGSDNPLPRPRPWLD